MWSIRDAVEGTQIFGAIGSGKTSGSGATIARSFLQAGFGGLVLCSKPEEARLWRKYAKECGRTDSLVEINKDSDWRFNWLDYEYNRTGAGGGMTENLVSLFITAAEIAGGKRQVQDSFWQDTLTDLLRNLIDLLGIAKGQLSLMDMLEVVNSAPKSIEEARSEEWGNNSFCMECIRKGEAKQKTGIQQNDFDVTAKYWLQRFAGLDQKPRSIINTSFTSMASNFTRGIMRELFCTTTNIIPEACFESGRIIVLDFPVQEFGKLGLIAQGIFKYVWQTSLLRRDPECDPLPVFLWSDEAQNFISSFDREFQSVARSARVCTVYLTQNISNYYATLESGGGRAQTDAFLGNLVTHIYHSNSDQITNEYAANRIAKDWRMRSSLNTSENEQGQSSGFSASEQVEYQVLPYEFTRLKKGGPQNGCLVEAIIFQSGREWRTTGKTYLRTNFKQQ